MRWANMALRSLVTRLCVSPVSWLAVVLVATGLLLGVTVHKGFLILMVLGAFGPNVLRQFGLLNDSYRGRAIATGIRSMYRIERISLTSLLVFKEQRMTSPLVLPHRVPL